MAEDTADLDALAASIADLGARRAAGRGAAAPAVVGEQPTPEALQRSAMAIHTATVTEDSAALVRILTRAVQEFFAGKRHEG